MTRNSTARRSSSRLGSVQKVDSTTMPVAPTTLRRSPRLAEKEKSTATMSSKPLPRRLSNRTNKRDSLSLLPQSPKISKGKEVASTSPANVPRSILKPPIRIRKSIAVVTPDAGSRRLKLSKSRRSSSLVPPSSVNSVVKFGENSSAEFQEHDPPNRFERLSTDATSALFPNESAEPPHVVLDEETRLNEAILAEWDNFSDSSSEPGSHSDREEEEILTLGECGRRLVMVEEIDLAQAISPNVARRRPKSTTRTVVQKDVVACKFCNRGVVRTSTYIFD